MFGKKKQPPIKSLFAQGGLIQGDLHFSEGLRLDGAVIGNIHASEDVPSILVVSEVAHVRGEIHADHVIINGAVDGPVYARTMLELQPKARICGDVHYLNLEMHQGAIVAGQLKPVAGQGEKPLLKLTTNEE